MRPLSSQAGSHLVAKVGSGLCSPDRPTDGEKNGGRSAREAATGADENVGADMPLGDGEISVDGGVQARVQGVNLSSSEAQS
mmetsp:Transcript_5661/g.12557  ORF Transcript_5661/g.12557 Transcript_5661/m.12557 type:complete len:82 (+) Transcript_5661:1-246(+)